MHLLFNTPPRRDLAPALLLGAGLLAILNLKHPELFTAGLVMIALSLWLWRAPRLALAVQPPEMTGRSDFEAAQLNRRMDDEAGRQAEELSRLRAEVVQLKAELKTSEERFRQIAENIRGVFWMIEPVTSRVLYVSSAYETVWGRSRASLYESPHDWEALIDPEDKERIRSAVVQRHATGVFDQEYRLIRDDGSVRWIHDRGFSVRNDKGEVYCVAGIAEDVTERKHAEAAFLEKDQQLRAVVDRAPIIVFAINKDGVITTEEGNALHELNIKPGQNVGRHMVEVFGDYPKLIENLNRSLFGEEFTDVEEFRGQFFSTWHAPQRDWQGNIIGMVGVATNVSARFQLERQVLEISDREQARIGQDLHDGLCQVLVGTGFAINILEEKLAAREAPELAAAHEIAAMVDDALTQARSTAYGLYPARLEEEGLASALGELATHVSVRHELECQFEYPEPVLLSDNAATIQLYRIVQEAVSNAVKHAHARRIVIRLAASNARVNLSVIDDGVGFVEPRKHHRGMGLNIMKYRARTIGATINIRRGRNGGTEMLCWVAEKSPEPTSSTKEQST